MDRMRKYLTAMCTGWDVQQIRDIVNETLHEIIDPLVYNEAVELIMEHKAAGRDVVIISSSGDEVVRPIGEMVGADHVIATRMVVQEGHYTGEIEFYAYGPNKAEGLRELAAERGYDLADSYAYSDSITDVPMLEAVGHPYVVNPDKALRKVAAENHWPALAFTNAVPLRERLGGLKAPQPATSAAMVAGAAGVAALLWYGRSRKSQRG
jgi:HAD superfamily hydrolase (TIGR01490 family)